ncbi:MORN repeat containing protein-like protein [Dinothrombium tinctorium]|uniref:MORN repeat containing protein-like protein n=1 Tax=Dinothrombium tinctorium TaxID=1965070 RepID=A0A3S3SMJ7_9ACAR|nr:MORN repeat containing protein-like protein [Dinothrombium tinctorium]
MSSNTQTPSQEQSTLTVGGRFDFDDGGVYVGGWQDGKAHGHGICTGPKSQGEYSGSWHFGFEVSGVYKWPSGATYEGQWQNGKRHGLGVEYRGKWVYKGEWTQGYKGRYGVRASLLTAAKYEGTWANGLQDGYGSETYADGGTYQGQWQRGLRHGYGVRQSAPFGHCNITKTALITNTTNASMHSLDTEADGNLIDQKRDAAMRGGFVLVVKNTSSNRRRNSLVEKSSSIKQSLLKGLRLKKQKSAGDIDVRSQRSSASVASSTESGYSNATSMRGGEDHGDAGSNASFLSQDGDISDPSTTETYMGEWKNDKRCGFGICERSDGLRYEGEWYNNKKYGYGVTIFKDGTREEGKYKNNQLVTSVKKKHLFVLRSSKLRERIESAVAAGHRAQQIALQKADIAISRTATARGKSEQADFASIQARNDSQVAYVTAKQYGGDISQLHAPEVPLRRRLSDFSQVRRNTKELIAQNQQQPQIRQFLDPNEPFGGRRGSFRNQNSSKNQPNQTQSPLMQPKILLENTNPPSASLLQQQQNLNHQQPHQSHIQQVYQQPTYQNPPSAFQTHSPQTYQPHPKEFNSSYQSSQEPFADHFDHYQKLVLRYANPHKFDRQTPVRKQRLNSHGYQNKPGSTGTNSSNSPKSEQSSDQPTPDSGISSLDECLINRRAVGSQMSDTMSMSAEDCPSPNKQWRTTSLYRPPPATVSKAIGGGGSGGVGAIKRKPSLQPNPVKQINKPLMSREEVSVLSHAQREQRRLEAEMAERLSRNPFLYLVNPRFKDWLNRQQLIILVLLINVSLAILFFKLLG